MATEWGKVGAAVKRLSSWRITAKAVEISRCDTAVINKHATESPLHVHSRSNQHGNATNVHGDRVGEGQSSGEMSFLTGVFQQKLSNCTQ
jgi:hypothetical protein